MSCSDDALGSFAISEANPAGVNPREGAAFTLAQTEIEKLTNIYAESGVDWHKVGAACAKVLSEEGKDLNAAIWLLCAWTQTRGLPGLATGVHVLHQMLELYWDNLTPPPSRLRARRNQAEWMLEWLTAKIEESFPALEVSQLESLLKDWDALDTVWREYDAEGPAFFRMRRRLSQLPVEAIAEPELEPVSADVPGDSQQVRPVPTPVSVAQPVSQSSAMPSGTPPALGTVQPIGTLDSDESVENAITGVFASFSPLVDFCLESRTTLPLLFRLNRQMAWMTLEQAPPSQSNMTRLPAPPQNQLESFARLQSVGEPLDIVRFCEGHLGVYPLWLDLNRVCHAALSRLGSAAVSAAVSLTLETQQLLARLPALAELTFADGQPFADGATRSWLEGLAPVSRGGAVDAIQTLIDEARQSAATGQLKDAMTRLQDSLRDVASGRDRFRLRKAQYELLHRFDPSLQLRVALDVLLQEAKEQRLDRWEPELVQPLLELAQSYDESGSRSLWAEQLAAMDMSAFWHFASPQAG
ncbi:MULTISPECIES: type VI secretion system protein TssA [unclassified Pseudomonas]|uniref:type VI secretion system protein TssA n=1 Tax=unclassified Pseudomonas TaxID=196821 RepID=UPI0030D8A54A